MESKDSQCKSLLLNFLCHTEYVKCLALLTQNKSIFIYPLKSFIYQWNQSDFEYDFPRCNDNYVLELDLEPFNATFPRPTRSSSIGNGVQFLNRHLSSIMFRNKESLEPLLDFLRTHKHDGHVSLKRHGFC